MKWYVLQVKTGLELQIAQQLQKRGFKAIAPTENRVIRRKGKWIQEVYVVFTGYVFIFMNYNWSKYYAMSGISGIIKILGGGKEPIPLKSDEINFIVYLTEMLKEPSVLKFDSNNNYEIVSGFLLDFKDNIVKIQRRQKKAVVKITLANEEKEFKVSFVEQTQEQTVS